MHLHPHPGSPASPATAVQIVAARFGGNKLSLVFDVSGDIGRIRLPSVAKPARKDNLWKRTCFEAFVRAPVGRSYFELNLAPSGDWAAYRFDDYRSGMQPADIPAPSIHSRSTHGHLRLTAEIDLTTLAELGSNTVWQLGVSAVIEADDASLSHWSLVHPPGPPNFHHPDCFVLELPPAGQP